MVIKNKCNYNKNSKRCKRGSIQSKKCQKYIKKKRCKLKKSIKMSINTSNIIAWNVNGLRSIVKKINFNKFLNKYKPDIICMSETKLSLPDEKIRDTIDSLIMNYKYKYYSTCSKKKGYSGTTIWCKKKPIKVTYGIGIEKSDDEGRVITCEFKNYFLITVYTPNSGQILQRLQYRVYEWDIVFREYIKKLQKKKPVIISGDLNCAHKDIDIFSPKTKKKSPGFTLQERQSFGKLLSECNLIDSFRYLYPNKKDQYTYWSYRPKSTRGKNKGWRLDYFLVDKRLIKNIKDSEIIKNELGSDHAPIKLLHNNRF